ncbi:hypothetical protein J2X71_001270 [Rhizobium sp. 1399]|nr:hypothetical protein [Rhizobium sp. 1399]
MGDRINDIFVIGGGIEEAAALDEYMAAAPVRMAG